ncbi:hypothetical protein NHH03_15785 [Stieleria sp. TO1_6]|uniref:hypothetical protein n=1 Tax=Stieleria tagensis TaxID=2956795 RepID=UPI00209B0A3E|nr:hypothetical protein [Stieleria tagensis]MCO8123209.1 hypothetical protein [Stieleria tagensis]
MKTRFIFSAMLASGLFVAVGCDVDVQHNASPDPVPAQTVPAEMDTVVTDSGETPAEQRVERRQERRENIRDAVDGVDVNVGDGGVKVQVDE